MDLYITSPDWTEFSYSRKVEEIVRIRIGLFSYLLATMEAPIKNNIDKTASRQILITNTFHFIRRDYISRLPLELNVFSIKTDNNGNMICGECLAKGVDLHSKRIWQILFYIRPTFLILLG